MEILINEYHVFCLIAQQLCIQDYSNIRISFFAADEARIKRGIVCLSNT